MTNTLKTTALLAALTALLIVIGDALGGRGGMLLFFGFAIVLNMGAYWFSGDIALRMAGAREVSPDEAPEVHQLVQELATYARLPKPRVAMGHVRNHDILISIHPPLAERIRRLRSMQLTSGF